MSLSADIRKRCIQAMGGHENLDIKAHTVARVYKAIDKSWQYDGLWGALWFVMDKRYHNAAFFRLIDMETFTIIFQQELYEQFAFRRESSFFFSFESDDCLFGFSFAEGYNPHLFSKAVHKHCTEEMAIVIPPQISTKKQRHASTPQLGVNSTTPTTPSSAKVLLSKFKKMASRFSKKEEEFEMSDPSEFTHRTHISTNTESDEILKALTGATLLVPDKKKQASKSAQRSTSLPPDDLSLPPPPSSPLPPPLYGETTTSDQGLPPLSSSLLPPPLFDQNRSTDQGLPPLSSSLPPPGTLEPPTTKATKKKPKIQLPTPMPANLLQDIRSVDRKSALKSPPATKITAAVPKEEHKPENNNLVSFLHDAINHMNMGHSSDEDTASDFGD